MSRPCVTNRFDQFLLHMGTPLGCLVRIFLCPVDLLVQLIGQNLVQLHLVVPADIKDGGSTVLLLNSKQQSHWVEKDCTFVINFGTKIGVAMCSESSTNCTSHEFALTLKVYPCVLSPLCILFGFPFQFTSTVGKDSFLRFCWRMQFMFNVIDGPSSIDQVLHDLA